MQKLLGIQLPTKNPSNARVYLLPEWSLGGLNAAKNSDYMKKSLK